MAIAERRRITIVSADSRQLYRGFDIGTAKPAAADRARVPHEGVDVADPSERWSAGRWSDAAAGWIAAAERAGRTPVLVGGTGLYLRALVEPFFEEPPIDPARRARLAAELGTWTTARLRDFVERIDPARARLGRAPVLRALEVALLSGRRLSALHEEARRPRARPARYLVVDPGERLRQWIADRVAAMFDAGWEEEVRGLAARVSADAPAWNAAGYEVVRRLVRGEITRETAMRLVTDETRQYAKRQRTWFRHQLPADAVTRIDPARPDALEAAARWWDASA